MVKTIVKKSELNKQINKFVKGLNLLPKIILEVTNIINRNKMGLVPAISLSKDLYNNYKEIEGDIVFDDYGRIKSKEKKFFDSVFKIFMNVYENTNTMGKLLVLVSVANIIRNEIPKIKENAKKLNFLDDEAIYLRILTNITSTFSIALMTNPSQKKKEDVFSKLDTGFSSSFNKGANEFLKKREGGNPYKGEIGNTSRYW